MRLRQLAAEAFGAAHLVCDTHARRRRRRSPSTRARRRRCGPGTARREDRVPAEASVSRPTVQRAQCAQSPFQKTHFDNFVWLPRTCVPGGVRSKKAIRTSLFLSDCACQRARSFSHSKTLWKFISVAELGLGDLVTGITL